MKTEPPMLHPNPRKFLRGTAVAATTLAAAALISGCSAKTEADPPSSSSADTASNLTLTAAQREHIRAFTVKPSEFHKAVEVTGTVDFDQDQATSVVAPFSGPVSQLLVSVGQQVKSGEPLAKVESPDFASAISAYQKALATAKTARRLADLDKRLLSNRGVAEKEAEQAETDAVNAESDRDAARQQLVALDVDPETIKAIENGKTVSSVRGTIRAPLAGTVVEKQITPGQLLQAGSTPCFTIADVSRVWVMAHLFGADLDSVRVGDTAEITRGAVSNVISGTVDNISPLVDSDTRSVMVRVVADNSENVLRKNQYVRVRIRARQPSTGLLVPVSAILRDGENLPFVYVALPEGTFARRPVTLGYRTDDQYEITSGLSAGDQIVTEGGLFVQFMQAQ